MDRDFQPVGIPGEYHQKTTGLQHHTLLRLTLVAVEISLVLRECQRIRMGVGGKPEGYDLADYVLGHFSPSERTVMAESVRRAADAAVIIMKEGPDAAMNRFNQKNGSGKGMKEGS